MIILQISLMMLANKLVDIDVSALPSESAKTLYNTIATATLPAKQDRPSITQE